MILYIILFGLIVRLCVGLRVGYGLDSDYARIARNIAGGSGYSLSKGHPTAWRTPGYTLILAGLMALFGEEKLPFIAFLSIVGAVNAGLCSWLGIKIFNRKIALVSGLLYIFIPYLAQKEATSNNGLITLGILSGLCLLWKGWKNKSFIYIGLSGLCFAFAYLVSPTIGLIPLFVSLFLLAAFRSNKNISWRLISATILVSAFAIGIFPWGARNYKVFKRFYISQTFFWYDVYTGNHTRTFELYPYLSLDNFLCIFPLTGKRHHTDEFKQDLWFRRQALAAIRKCNLKENLNRMLRKFIYLWNIRMVPYTDRRGNDPLTGRTLDVKRSLIKNLTFSLPYLFLLGFALLGSWLERKRWAILLFSGGLLLAFSIPYMVTVAYSRYAAQMYFVLILLAARGFVPLLERCRLLP